MSSPKISVIVPVYNNEDFLDKCLTSLVNQTLKDIEIICVNDESSDSSLDILNNFKSKDDRIIVLSQENQGAGAARNNGIDHANGEYISLIDGDDWLELDALEKLYTNAIGNDSDLVLFNAVERKADDKTRDRIYIPIDDETDYDSLVFDFSYAKNLVMNSMFVVWSKLYKTSFLKENDLKCKNYKIFNDMQFHIESMLLAERISYVPEILYNYNKLNENSLQTSASNSNKRLLIFDVFNDVKEFLINHNLFDEFKSNYLKFKITESKVNLEKTTDENKEEYYRVMRDEFLRMDVDKEILNEIPIHLYKFYIRVLNCFNYGSFRVYIVEFWKGTTNFVNKKEMSEEIESFDEMGINPNRDENSIIVSLTSFPQRMDDIHYCLYSLLTQSLKPHKVILWLAESQFPNREEDLPDTVLNFKKNGLEIQWYKDIKSYKKLIPALINYPDFYIATADDDVYYPKNWLEELWKAHEDYPDCVIASRARRIGFKNDRISRYNEWKLIHKTGDPSYLYFPTGAGGTLYLPNAFSEIILDEELFTKLSPSGDDIWFWAMMVLNNIKIKPIRKPVTLSSIVYVNRARERGVLNQITLWGQNEQGYNDSQLENVLNQFPEILDIIIMDER